MEKLNLGLIGFGNVGSGLVKLLKEREHFIRKNYNVHIAIKKVCDKKFRWQPVKGLAKKVITTRIGEVTRNKDIDVVVELIGGLHPAKEIILDSLKNGKHIVTANKELIAHHGRELFLAALRKNLNIYFESAVGAGIPMINTIEAGLAGNKFNRLYGIVNGTCNYILSEMSKSDLSFSAALKEAQKKGFAESNPTLDINGMDSVHKLAILVFLSMGKFVRVKDIHVEGITHISHCDIEYAKSLNLVIKLLAIAKRVRNEVEVRVHPTLISRDHPLASVNGVFNALFLDTNPLGDVLLYGRGAGQMPAASGVLSDLLNLAARESYQPIRRVINKSKESAKIKLTKIDAIDTR